MKNNKLFLMLFTLAAAITFVGCIGRIGGMEIIVILIIVILLFGAKKLPELAKALGHGLREFKKATKEFESAKDGEYDDVESKSKSKSKSEKEKS